MTARAFWDAQFRFSEILPDFAEALVRMEEESARFAAAVELRRARYGADARQWVEWTEGEGPREVLPVVIHGGYWRALRAEDHRFLMAPLRRHGGAVANVEYRLMPGVRMGEVVADLRAALGHLAALFPEAELLPVGHSAGAHLALSAMADPELAARTRGVLALSGIHDLRPVAQSFLQDELSLTDAEIETFSLRPGRIGPPVLHVNGGAETHEFLRSGALMASAGTARWRVIAGADHMSLLRAVCAQMEPLLAELEALK